MVALADGATLALDFEKGTGVVCAGGGAVALDAGSAEWGEGEGAS